MKQRMTKMELSEIKFEIESYAQEYITDDGPVFVPHPDTYNINGHVPHAELNHVRIWGTKSDQAELMKLYETATKTNKTGDWLRLFAQYSDMREKELNGENVNDECVNGTKLDAPCFESVFHSYNECPFVKAIVLEYSSGGIEEYYGYHIGNWITGVKSETVVYIQPVIFIPALRRAFSDSELVWSVIMDENEIKKIEDEIFNAENYVINKIERVYGIKYKNLWIADLKTHDIRKCDEDLKEYGIGRTDYKI